MILITSFYLSLLSLFRKSVVKMPAKKFCAICKKWFCNKGSLNKHVKKFHDGDRTVSQLAETDPWTVRHLFEATAKVREFIFPEDIMDELDRMVLSKQLKDWKKVTTGDVSYLKLKIKHLGRKSNKRLFSLISDTFDSAPRKCMETHKDEIIILRNANLKREIVILPCGHSFIFF